MRVITAYASFCSFLYTMHFISQYTNYGYTENKNHTFLRANNNKIYTICTSFPNIHIRIMDTQIIKIIHFPRANNNKNVPHIPEKLTAAPKPEILAKVGAKSNRGRRIPRPTLTNGASSVPFQVVGVSTSSHVLGNRRRVVNNDRC